MFLLFTCTLLPGRDELITEHAISWNKRKIHSMVVNLVKRRLRVTVLCIVILAVAIHCFQVVPINLLLLFLLDSKMCASSYKDCDTVLAECNLDRKDVSTSVWKEEIIQHAKGLFTYRKNV